MLLLQEPPPPPHDQTQNCLGGTRWFRLVILALKCPGAEDCESSTELEEVRKKYRYTAVNTVAPSATVAAVVNEG